MVKAIGANTRCACGSGRKYKNCHGAAACTSAAGKNRAKLYIGAVLALLVIGGLIVMQNRPTNGGPGGAPAGKVWSAEHNHWHDAP